MRNTYSNGRRDLRDSSKPYAVQPGIVLVLVPSSDLVPHVQRAFEKQCARGSERLGLSLGEKLMVCSLRALPWRGFETERQMAEAAASTEQAEVVLKHVCHFEGFQWLKREGLAVILPELASAPKKWVSIAVRADTVDEESAEHLERLRGEAKQAGSRLLIFLVGKDDARSDQVLARLEQQADDVAVVDPCEPEPDSLLGFSIKWRGLEQLEAFGHRGVMCSVAVKEGRFAYRFAPLIHSQLSTRFMWMLACEGASLKGIAELFGLNKSTVMRRIASLPPRLPKKRDLGWERAYMRSLGLRSPRR